MPDDRHLAAAAERAPAPLAAGLAQRLGAARSAQVVARLSPERAAALAARLPAAFLADVAARLPDPRVVAALPADVVERVAAELAARDDLAALARFAPLLGDRVLDRCLEHLRADQLLRTAALLRHDARLDAIVARMDHGRLLGVVAAARADRRWREAWAVLGGVGRAQQLRLTAVAAQVLRARR